MAAGGAAEGPGEAGRDAPETPFGAGGGGVPGRQEPGAPGVGPAPAAPVAGEGDDRSRRREEAGRWIRAWKARAAVRAAAAKKELVVR